MRRLWIGLLVVVSVPALAEAQTRGLLPQDFYRITQVGDVTVSPPGDHIAFTTTTVVEKDNRRHREVWVQRLKTGQPDGKPFRFTDPTREASGPKWSPDGTLLSFTSRRSGDRNSTWFVRLDPPSGEAFHVDGVEGAPVWSADGKWIAYLKEPGEASDDSDRNTREGWISPSAVSHTLDAKRFDGHVVTSMRTKRDGTLALLGDPAIRRKNQLFVVAASGGAPRQITKGNYAVRSVLWSADGQTLLFTGDESEDDEYNSEPLADIYAVSVEQRIRAQAHDQSGFRDRPGPVAQGRPAGVRADAHARRRDRLDGRRHRGRRDLQGPASQPHRVLGRRSRRPDVDGRWQRRAVLRRRQRRRASVRSIAAGAGPSGDDRRASSRRLLGVSRRQRDGVHRGQRVPSRRSVSLEAGRQRRAQGHDVQRSVALRSHNRRRRSS